MPRNSGGSYVLPGSPFVPGTVISSNDVNVKFLDLGNAITDSLSRTGIGGMLAPLALQDGSAGVPSLTWTTDAASGFYLAAPGDIRLVSSAATIQRWTLTAVEVNRPLVVAATTSNSVAVTGTGAGTGAGGSFTGGSTNGRGVQGTATGTGSGVYGAGGPNSGTGVEGVGGATNGVGVSGAGAGSGAGVLGTGGATNGAGVAGNGTAAGAGGLFIGGATGAGITATGGASGRGATLTGGTAMEGALVVAGTAQTATTQRNALIVSNGNIAFTTVNLNSNVAASNTLTPSNIPKAWAKITVSGATATINAGFNIASAVVSGSPQKMTVTFAQAMSSAEYCPNVGYSSTAIVNVDPLTPPTASAFTIRITDASGTVLTLNTGVIYLSVFGLQ